MNSTQMSEAETKHKENMPLRIRLAMALLVITPLGFAFKKIGGPWGWWFNDYAAGALYEIFWCLVFAFFRPRSRPVMIALCVFFITSSLEFLQLWHPHFLETFRSFYIGRTLLGTTFSWSDFPYYGIGSAAGGMLVHGLAKFRKPSKGK